jgi:SAM-dependent methyltransferase
MFHLEDAYWWYVGMRQITERLLRRDVFRSNGAGSRRILDAGSGTGGSLQLLRRYGEVTAFDFAPQAAAMYRTREAGRIAVASIDSIPFADGSFDLVTAFDVVCQLPAPADQQALRELGRVVKPGGTVLVRVPAFQFLYGPHDVVLHTSHRYSAPEMAAKLEEAGLRLVGTTYANTLLFPVALARRLLARFGRATPTDSDVRPVPAPLNSLLTRVLSLEAPLISRVRLPFGLSLVAIARRP